jgi:hypothetical protein
VKDLFFNVIAKREQNGGSRFVPDEAIRCIQPRGSISTDCFVIEFSRWSNSIPRNDVKILLLNAA